MNHVRNGKRVLFGLPFAMCLCLVPWPSSPSPLALCTSPLPLLLLLAQVDSILCFFTRISSLLPLPPHVLYAIYFMLVFLLLLLILHLLLLRLCLLRICCFIYVLFRGFFVCGLHCVCLIQKRHERQRERE